MLFAANRLSLNIGKTNYIVFLNKIIHDTKISINNQGIDRVYSINFLGVTIDAKPTRKEHIANIRAKLSKYLAVFFKSSKLLDLDCLRLYFSLPLPYITYCS